MSGKFLIDGRVWYDPEGHILTLVNDPKKAIILPVPAGRCLTFLLAEHGKIITIRQFHERVWNENKIVVSNNTIYQNISVLRKSLHDLGEGNIIETQTKKGWRIPESVLVTREEYPEDKDDRDVLITDNVPKLTEKSLINVGSEVNKIKRVLVLSGALLFLSFFSFIYAVWQGNNDIPVGSFASYKKIGEHGTCHIYRNISNVPDEAYTALLHRNQLPCRDLSWWYITMYTKKGASSITSCRNPLARESNEPPECNSLYFRGVKNYD